MEASKIRLTVPEGVDPSRVLGAGDGVLRALESLVRAHVVARGDSIAVSGDPDEVELVARFFEHAFREAAAGRTLSADDVSRCLAVLRDGEHEATSLRDDVLLSYRGRVIRPKTLGQNAMWMPSARIPSRLAWVQPVPVRLIWPWRSPLPRSSATRWAV